MVTRRLSLGLGLGLAMTLAGCTDAGSGPPSGLVQEPIVGGKADTTSHSVIGILTRQGELCSGSLILPNLVLTARHCVAAISGNGENVQCGVSTFGALTAAGDFAVSWDDNLRSNVASDSVFDVRAVRVPTDTGVCGNDIALLELSSNVPAAQATPLEPRLDTAPMTNETFDAVGYGLTNPNDQAGTTAGQRMRFSGARVSCVGAACRNLGAAASEWGGESPVCSGDSGGPALDADGKVIGAASRGPADCMSAVYSGVSTWKSFILTGATTAVSDGGYAPPAWVSGTTTSDGGSAMMDGGAPSDAGVGTSDGGMPSDAGVGKPDGGMPSDAGVGPSDAGMPNDAGSGMPGGGMRDGGAPGDAGSNLPDAGRPMDAGSVVPDAGTPSDAGTTPPDAGTHVADAGVPTPDGGLKQTDAGVGANAGGAGRSSAPTTPPADSGCGCRTTPRGVPAGFDGWPLYFAAVVAATRRRKSTRRQRA